MSTQDMKVKNNNYDWTRFKRVVFIKNTTKKTLFEKWVTSIGLESWFIKKASFISSENIERKPEEETKAGDLYSWTFHNGTTIKGKILVLKKNEKIKFTFGKADQDAENEVTVQVTFFNDEESAGFELLQENMTKSKESKVNYYISCDMGWEFHMMNLKSIIEANHDLRILDGTRMHVDAPSAYPLENYSWTEFTVREYLNTDLKTVYSYWAVPEKITKWFIKEASYQSQSGEMRLATEKIQSGDNYTWIFGSELTMKGKIIEAVEDDYIIFTFGKKESDSDEYVIVKVNFEQFEGGTRIKVYQSNIADNEFGQVTYNLSCILGWAYYMTNLRSIIESGLDLRETNPKKDLTTRSKTL